MAVLHLHPRAVDVEEALDEQLRMTGGPTAVVLGLGRMTVRNLLEQAFAAGGRPVRLGPLGERLLVEAVASEEAVAGGLLGPLRGTVGLVRSLGRLIAAWQQAGMEPAQVAEVARRAGRAEPRLMALAGLFARYRQRLGARVDEATVRRVALATLCGDGRPLSALQGIDRVVVHRAGSDPQLLDVVEALATRGLVVEPELPLVAGPGRPRPLLERAIEPLARRLEAHADLPIEPCYLPPGARSEREDPGLWALLADLFLPQSARRAQPPSNARVDVLRAPTPDAEARAVARAVRDLLAGGAAPQAVAVCARRPADRDRVARWLSRYGVPCTLRPGPEVTQAVPVRLALQLGRLADDQVPREALIAFLSSRYIAGASAPGAGRRGPRVAPHRIARLLRQAGVRDAEPEQGVHGYRGRLDELARAQSSPERRAEVERVAARVDEWLAFFHGLPEAATLAEHASALSRAVEALELPLRARGYVTSAEAGLEDVEPVARDQAAIAVLLRLLGELPRAAVRAGLAAERIDRARFGRLLEGLLGAETLRPGGASGGQVEVATPELIAGRRFDHVLALGLIDGVQPARGVEDPLLSDEDRRVFNRLVRREVLPLAATVDEREPLLFLEMCAAATVSLGLSCPLADEAGRPVLPSPYLDEVARATSAVPRVLGHDPVPLSADCRTPAELRARMLLESEAPAASRISERDPDVSAALLSAGERAFAAEIDGARQVIAIERGRLEFFSGRASADRFSGRLADPAALAALATVLPGSASDPLSASSLERYAACGFRFFAGRLLRLRPAEENADDLDPAAAGRIYHRVLERFFRRMQAAGGLPLRGAPAELTELDAAADEVLGQWTDSEQRGHPSLFAVRADRVRRDLRGLIRAEGRLRFFAPLVPRYFEQPFEAVLPGAAADGGDLHLRAVIDRIDTSSDRAVVIDYKSSRLPGLNQLLRPETLLTTSFQLPLYAAIARERLGLPAVSARYLSIRDADVTDELGDAGRFTLESGAGGDADPATLAATVTRIHHAMSDGDFRVAPHSCKYCELAAACRVVLRSGLDEEAGE